MEKYFCPSRSKMFFNPGFNSPRFVVSVGAREHSVRMIGRSGAGAHGFCCAPLSVFCRIVGDLLSFLSFVPICACMIHCFLSCFC